MLNTETEETGDIVGWIDHRLLTRTRNSRRETHAHQSYDRR